MLPIGIRLPIGAGYDLTTFLVIGNVGDAPLDLFGRKRDFKLCQKLLHVARPAAGLFVPSAGMAVRPPSAREVCLVV